MDCYGFREKCLYWVRDYYKDKPRSERRSLGISDIEFLYLTRAGKNNRAMVTTKLEDGRIFDITYDGIEREVRIKIYKEDEDFTFKWGG